MNQVANHGVECAHYTTLQKIFSTLAHCYLGSGSGWRSARTQFRLGIMAVSQQVAVLVVP